MASAAPNTVAVGGSASGGNAVTQFVTRNRRAVLITAAALVGCCAAGYYYHQTQSTRPDQPGGDNGTSASSIKKKKKKSKSKKSTTSGTAINSNDDSASLTADESATTESDNTNNNKSKATVTGEADEDPSATDVALLSSGERSKMALTLKAKGNKLYSAKKFQAALEQYTKAIACEEQAVFYSNRAACYTNLQQLDKVVEDCTSALRLDPSYIKALNRRGTAREQLGGIDNLYLALCDFTAAAIIDNFQTESTQVSVEKVMKKLATEKAQKMMATREPRLPSATFIKAYLEAFREQPKPSRSEHPTQGDEQLQLAFAALEAKDYTHAFSLFHESLSHGVEPNTNSSNGISTSQARAAALNMRATFRFIISEAQQALADLDEATRVYPQDAQSWVKKASVHMELGRPEEAMKDFDRALEVDPENADVFYHRGQVYFITQDFDRAIAEYRRSSELEPAFIFSHIQLAVAQYKNKQVDKALHQFKRFTREHPSSPEVFNYYGELLLDQGNFEEAVDKFDKAIELGRDVTPRNALPLVNKALAIFQWKQDFSTAERICREAIDIDEQCDVAIATLAQLLLQQNKVHDAVTMFARSAEMARTEPELVNALTYECATRAQIAFITAYPSYAERLGLDRNSDSK